MIALLVQIALFVALIEVALWCLPTAARRASQANCFRPGGTRSATRTGFERRAYHRVRLELAPAFLLIFLLGNAAYQTIDRSLVPVDQLIEGVKHSFGLATATGSATGSISAGTWTRVATLVVLWLCISLTIGVWRLVVAGRSFSEGVRTRSSEYAQFDVTRTVSQSSKRKKSSASKDEHNVA